MKKIVLLMMLAVAVLATTAQAATLMYEGFDYTGTSLDTQSGGTGWSGAWSGGGTNITLSDDATSLDSAAFPFTPVGARVEAAAGGDAYRDLGTTIDMGADGVTYFSVLIKENNSLTGLRFYDSSSTQGLRFGITGPGAFVQVGTGSTDFYLPAAAETDPVFIVGKLVSSAAGTDTFYLRAYAATDTVDTADPITWDLTSTGTTSLVLSEINIWVNAAGGELDEIRIGETWEDVVLVPEKRVLVVETDGDTIVDEESTTSDTFDVSLSRIPTANVVVDLTYDSNQITVTPVQLTFAIGTWDVPQTVTVTAVDDALVENYDNPTHSTVIDSNTTSGDTGYNGIIGVVAVDINENDVPSITNPEDFESYGTGDTLTMEDGWFDWTDFVLSAPEPNLYEIKNVISDSMKVIQEVDTAPFTKMVWDVSVEPDAVQTLTYEFKLEDDFAGAEQSSVYHMNSSFEVFALYDGFAVPSAIDRIYLAAYGGPGGTVEVNLPGTGIVNNTWYGVEVLSDTVNQTVKARYWELPGSPTDNWTATLDTRSVAEDSHLVFAAWEIAYYDNIELSVVDSGMNIVITDGNTIVTEGGATDTFDVNLVSNPGGTVTVTLLDFEDPNQVTVTPSVLTFNGNWAVPQTVTVTAIDDANNEAAIGDNGKIWLEATGSLTGLDAAVYTVLDNECGSPDQEGQSPYFEGDINRDCYVDFLDIALLTANWVKCTQPNTPGCE